MTKARSMCGAGLTPAPLYRKGNLALPQSESEGEGPGERLVSRDGEAGDRGEVEQ